MRKNSLNNCCLYYNIILCYGLCVYHGYDDMMRVDMDLLSLILFDSFGFSLLKLSFITVGDWMKAVRLPGDKYFPYQTYYYWWKNSVSNKIHVFVLQYSLRCNFPAMCLYDNHRVLFGTIVIFCVVISILSSFQSFKMNVSILPWLSYLRWGFCREQSFVLLVRYRCIQHGIRLQN